MNSRVRCNGCSHRCPCQFSTTMGPLVPSPSVSRPPDIESSDAALCAVIAGVRLNMVAMCVPMPMRVVCPASHASVVNASNPHDSPAQTDSYPNSSARRTRPSASW